MKGLKRINKVTVYLTFGILIALSTFLSFLYFQNAQAKSPTVDVEPISKCKSYSNKTCYAFKTIDIPTFKYKVVASWKNLCRSSNITYCLVCVDKYSHVVCWDKIDTKKIHQANGLDDACQQEIVKNLGGSA